ncbi:hypothetical protein PAHAL_6G221800 [Panicum hallii]|jgi:hypothetical protein|uniref:Uncharacterized protein n=1 Tax=Panicum hallii TaxID=206008 RepID=A0A2T8IH74_9POAL|nr:hypothetical protein PAHAL_6G221800 [Panicum hallii]
MSSFHLLAHIPAAGRPYPSTTIRRTAANHSVVSSSSSSHPSQITVDTAMVVVQIQVVMDSNEELPGRDWEWLPDGRKQADIFFLLKKSSKQTLVGEV